MKKFLGIAAALACTVMLAGCGKSEDVSEYDQDKIEYAELVATQGVIPLLEDVMNGTLDVTEMDEYTMGEVSYYVQNYLLGFPTDGYGFMNAIDSFEKGVDTVGMISEVGDPSTVIDDDQIIVTVPVTGTLNDGEVEVIFTNDYYTMELESATLNADYSMGYKMGKAALNTLVGMGTVFVVLILISLLISLFKFIPTIQKKFADKKAAKEADKNAATAGIDNAVNQIIRQEETAAEDLSDDTELVAVIAAAIAAYEGSGSTDGFTVRSIRRIKR